MSWQNIQLWLSHDLGWPRGPLVAVFLLCSGPAGSNDGSTLNGRNHTFHPAISAMLDLTLADAPVAGASAQPGSWLAFSPGEWVSAWTMWPWRHGFPAWHFFHHEAQLCHRPWHLRWSRPRNMPWLVRSRCADSLEAWGRPRTWYNTTDHNRFNGIQWIQKIYEN